MHIVSLWPNSACTLGSQTKGSCRPRFPSMHAVHKRGKQDDLWIFLPHYSVHPFTLITTQPLLARIRLQNTSWGSSRPPTSNAALLTTVSNNAALEHSHQVALFSKRLWPLLAEYERGISWVYELFSPPSTQNVAKSTDYSSKWCQHDLMNHFSHNMIYLTHQFMPNY